MSLDLIWWLHWGVLSINGNMAPWDEPPSKSCYASKKELLQMEKEKDANKVVEEMMNHIRELFPALDDEEVFK